MSSQSILIVGCGIAGPVLASFLLLNDVPVSEQPRITIVERSASPRPHGQNVDIRGAGVAVMRKLGLETAIKSNMTGEKGVEWVDGQNTAWMRLAADGNGPTSDIEILRGKLAEICYNRSITLSEESKSKGGPGIEYIFDDFLESIDQHGQDMLVRLAKGGERRFDIVVGADGQGSRTRRMVFGEQGVHKLGLYQGFFSMPRDGNDTDWRRFWHAPDRRGIMIRPSHDKTRSTVLLGIISDDERLAAANNIDTQKDIFKEYFQGTGWETDRIIKEMYAADDFYYAPVAQIKLDTWSKGRVVLLADAGYCASPISGKGTTLAMVGAYTLAGALKQHKDHTTAFAAYENSIRPIAQHAQKLVPGMPHLLYPETAWGIWFGHRFGWLVMASGMPALLKSFVSRPAEEAKVEEYGFRCLEDNLGFRQ